MRRIGYIHQSKTSLGRIAQRNRLVAAGVPERDILDADVGDDRFSRDMLTEPGPLPAAGTAVVLACEAYLGHPNGDRIEALRALAAKGVLVQVLDDDPVLYDTEDKIADFQYRAARVAKSDAGKATKGAGPGRPSKVRITAEQWRIIFKMWRDADQYQARGVMNLVADFTEENGLPRPVIRFDDMRGGKLQMGNRSDTDHRDPPNGLWVKPKER